MTKKRYDYLDIARGIGILMVVWAHIMVTGWSHELFYSFHMPLFFFLSGMVFQKGKYRSFGDFFVHRAKRLLLPYAIYSVVTWAFWAVFRYVRHDEVNSYVMPLFQTFIAQGSGAYFEHNSALWFIPCLFLTEILYFFISRLGRLWSIIVCFGCTAISFVLGELFGDNYWFLLPWNADAALIALPFYAVGNVLVKNVGHDGITKFVDDNKIRCILLWLCLFVPLFWSAISFGECSMGSSSYLCSAWIFMPRAFLGIVWLILFSILLGTVQSYNTITSILTRYAKWAGINSLDIMCLHIPLKGVFMILVAMTLHVTVDEVGNDYWYSLISFILTMISAWIIIRAIRRFL